MAISNVPLGNQVCGNLNMKEVRGLIHMILLWGKAFFTLLYFLILASDKTMKITKVFLLYNYAMLIIDRINSGYYTKYPASDRISNSSWSQT